VDAALKALAEPRRREILRLVWSEELPAAQIAARFGDVTRSAVSQHLAVLRQADLVVERRDGTRRLYRADHAQMDRLRRFLDEYWTTSLHRLQDLAESAEREKQQSDRQQSDRQQSDRQQSDTQQKGTTDG
jgi:DNA-binding transcriptional ArsR family regulator